MRYARVGNGIIVPVRPLRTTAALIFLAAFALLVTEAQAGELHTGSLTYQARVVHHNRSALSDVSGRIDLGTGNFEELVGSSYSLDWQQVPARISPAHANLPSIWDAGGQTCQRYDGGLPRFSSPLLRHFVVGQVIAGCGEVAKGATFLSGQLTILSSECHDRRFEIVASFNGAALVIVGKREQQGEQWLVRDIAVLGPQSELYQYFIDGITYSPAPLAQPVDLPRFNAKDYVEFPAAAQSSPVPIRPVKKWLVFQAQLPSGRQLNLVFDSGAQSMIVDDMVLKLDAHLEPVGEAPVAGAYETAQMQQYEGFNFEVGGVKFKNIPVMGTQLTSMGFGADVRVHGVIGSEILQLCQLDLDLEHGRMLLRPLGSAEPQDGLKVKLKLMNELPHIEAAVHGGDKAYLLVDTGQNTALSLNLDYLDQRKLGDDVVMDGFLGDITGSIAPHYKVQKLGLNIGGQDYVEPSVDASLESTYDFDGVPVAGAIGFPLFARHFGGLTFDYGRSALYLRDPGENRTFTGSPESWETVADAAGWFTLAGGEPGGGSPAGGQPAPGRDGRRPQLLPAREGGEGGSRNASAWASSLSKAGDPLDLVRSSVPAQPDAEGGGSGRQTNSLSRNALLLLLRDCADSVYAGLLSALGEPEEQDGAAQQGAGVDGDAKGEAAPVETRAVEGAPHTAAGKLDFGASHF